MVFGEASTGASDDLARATDLARKMVTEFGMSPILGPVRLATDMQANYLSQQLGLDARVSPETATLVDTETRRIIEEAVERSQEHPGRPPAGAGSTGGPAVRARDGGWGAD